MIVSLLPSGSLQLNLTLQYPDGNDETPLFPFTFFVFRGFLVEVININSQPEMLVTHPQSINQSLDEAFELATIPQFSIEVVRVEVVSVDAFAAGLAAFGGSPCCLLRKFSVICPRRWQ